LLRHLLPRKKKPNQQRLLLLLPQVPQLHLLRKKTPKRPTLKAHPPAIKKLKLLRSNPYRFTAINLAGLDPVEVTDDEDLYTIWRRQWVPKFKPDFDQDNEELSDYVKTRLLIARVRALQKYHEKWA
jgi:hypothetical protein